MTNATQRRLMEYRLFGRTGLRASQLILGAMTFGEAGDFGTGREGPQAIFDAYVGRGGNFIDTANGYTGGQSEEIVGKLLGGRRDSFILATKYTFNTSEGDPNAGGNHRKSLVRALDASLKRLGTDYIDVYWVHAWDFTTPVGEVMHALDDQVRAGKILYPAISDAPAWIVAQANTIAQERHWTPFYALQIEWNLIERTVERELVPMARGFDLSITPWSPLAGGVLTGKYSNGAAGDGSSLRSQFNKARLGARTEPIVAAVKAIAGELGATQAQVALAWLMAQGGDVFPILGAKRIEQLTDNLGALDVVLDAAQLQRLDEASRIELGFPHDFLQRAMSDQLPVKIFGVDTERVALEQRTH